MIDKPKLGRKPLKYIWANIKENFNGMIEIKVEEIPFEQEQHYPGKIIFHSREKVTPIFKWYRFSFRVTRRFMEDYGEGLINAGFPFRFKRGWQDFDTQTWIWYLIPFHIIIPALKTFKIWFLWKFIYDMNEWREKTNPGLEVIKQARMEGFDEGYRLAKNQSRWNHN